MREEEVLAVIDATVKGVLGMAEGENLTNSGAVRSLDSTRC